MSAGGNISLAGRTVQAPGLPPSFWDTYPGLQPVANLAWTILSHPGQASGPADPKIDRHRYEPVKPEDLRAPIVQPGVVPNRAWNLPIPDLFAAIRRDDWRAVAEALDCDPNAIHRESIRRPLMDGSTTFPLLEAVTYRSVKTVDLLTERGANVHQVTSNGDPGHTALYQAVTWSYTPLSIIRILAERGANVNRPLKNSLLEAPFMLETPFMHVMRQYPKDIETLLLLIKHGANLKSGLNRLLCSELIRNPDAKRDLIRMFLSIDPSLFKSRMALLPNLLVNQRKEEEAAGQLLTEINQELEHDQFSALAALAAQNPPKCNIPLVRTIASFLWESSDSEQDPASKKID